jgi:Glycosyl transferase family 2
MSKAPIAFFTYRRLKHTQRTIAALLNNYLASQSDLIIFSDGSKNETDIEDVAIVRDFLKTINGFLSVSIIHQEHNIGLAKSIISGVAEVLKKYGRVIVVEDDLLTSPYFLTYMNDGLDLYTNDERVVSIHGYAYPIEKQLPETFFLRGSNCWGWATWRRGWDCFNPDGAYLLNELEKRNLIAEFDFNGTYRYTQMLKDQIAGNNNSWAIRWYASAFLANKLTLHPGRSLVQNIGNDGSGTHCSYNSIFDTILNSSPVKLDRIKVEDSKLARTEFESFLAGISKPVSLSTRICNWLKKNLLG